jgi:mono/diheme cytochrome c family protein
MAAGSCADSHWVVATRPSDGLAEVVGGDNGDRLTPDVVGTWVVSLPGADDSLTITVVERDAADFEHFNYYPASSIAEVEGELWTANPWDASLSRIGDGADVERVAVGPWPVALATKPGLGVVLVAQRANDTVGFVDTKSARLVDAVWVGDEPAEIVLSEDGRFAFVALATEDAVAVVDVAARRVERRLQVVRDPLAMAVSGKTLWVASYRSGQADRAPFGSDPIEDERDIAAVDLETYEVRYLVDVGHTITSVLPSEDGSSLFVAHTRGDPFADFVAPADGKAAFRHEVMVVDAESGAVRATADLGRQPSSAGPVVGLRDLTRFAGRLWVASEGTDEVLGLNPTTLEEEVRVPATGRPRDLFAFGEKLYAHGAQAWTLIETDAAGDVRETSTGRETRSALLAEGQRFFTGAGETYGVHWSCNTCHVDGLSDTLVWKAGPFESRHSPRPLFWLEATMPLGWDGYSASARNFAHTGPVNIGVKPTSAEALALTAYLESLVPPPRANGRTRRDGSLSDEATLGEAVFDDAGCATCHGGALTTNRSLLDEGITSGLSDVPSLIGAYRHVAWLKHGDASTLRGAVEAAVEAFSDTPLPDDQLELLTRYVSELTARDFALIASVPERGDTQAAVDRPIRLVLSAPVFDRPENLARVGLVDAEDNPVSADIAASGRYVDIAPTTPLAHGARFEVRVEAGFESVDARTAAAFAVAFETAKSPRLSLDGEYRWVVDVPFPDFANGRFDNTRTVAVTTPVRATRAAVNSDLEFDFGDGLTYTAHIVVDGDELVAPGVPVPAGTALGDSRGLRGAMVDLDADGLADEVSGELTLTGPGFVADGITWRLVRPPQNTGCSEGPGGDVPVSLTFDAAGRPVVGWDQSEGNALAIYVTDPNATLPILPGQVVTDGAAYWAVIATAFPAGFVGPVTYGLTPEGGQDASVANGAVEGGSLLEAGRCYQFSVTTNNFETGFVIATMPGEGGP